MEHDRELHIIFGTGPVGRAVAHTLIEKGKSVHAINRSGTAELPAEVKIIAGDAADPAFTRDICKNTAVVYNCTNPPYNQWPALFPALQAGVLEGAASAGAKLIVMENLYMYGPTHGKTITEDLPYTAATRKGITRANMAKDLLKAHQSGKVRVAIGRASDFFGPGVFTSAAGEQVFYPALAGKAVGVIGKPDMPHTYSFIQDIGSALVILGERDEALGQVWHLPSPQTITTRQFITMVFEAAGHVPKFQIANKLMLRAVGLFNPMLRELVEMYYEFDEPFSVDHSKFAAAFGDHATPLRDAVKQTVAWFKANPKHN